MGAIGVLLFAAMLGVTVWGWTTVPDDARFPFAFGVPPSLQGTVGKFWGFVSFVIFGVWFFAGTFFAAGEEYAIGWVGVGLQAFFLAMEYRLVRRLSR